MSNSLRNKLALVLFFLLFLLGGALLALYIFLGHNWNFAATEIDVNSGNMSNYMVIVLEGQTPPVKPAGYVESAGTSENTSTSDNANANANANTNANADSDAGAGSNANTATSAVDGNAGSSSGNTNSGNTNSGGTGIRATIQRFFNLDTSESASDEEVSAAEESAVFSDTPKVNSVGDAYASYSVKGADVLPLYSKDLTHYAAGEIFIKGDYRIGVLGLTEIESYKTVQQKIDNLYDRGATLVVVLTKYAGLVALTHGVGVCVVVDGETQVLETTVENEMLTIKTGVKGSIDAIIFSPNHVVTAKTI